MRSKVAAAAMILAVPLVMQFEGLSLKSYLDPVGIATACYGATHGIKLGQTFTLEKCKILLNDDLGDSIDTVERLSKVKLNAYQTAALGSFVYNVGQGNFAKSTLLKKLNAGNIAGACNELPRWIYAKGIKLNGLIKRRNVERELCMKGI